MATDQDAVIAGRKAGRAKLVVDERRYPVEVARSSNRTSTFGRATQCRSGENELADFSR